MRGGSERVVGQYRHRWRHDLIRSRFGSSYYTQGIDWLAMDSDEAWDLEMELLGLVGTGSATIAKMTRLCQRIDAACGDCPQHVSELARLPTDSHRERDLHRWCNRQVWRGLLPTPYIFEVPLTYDGGQTSQPGEHAAILPHELFSSLYAWPDLFEDIYTGPAGNLEAFWAGCADADDVLSLVLCSEVYIFE